MDRHKTSPEVIRVKILNLTHVTIMHSKERVEQTLQSRRLAFVREAAFEWSLFIVWGILLCNRAPIITSYLNAS